MQKPKQREHWKKRMKKWQKGWKSDKNLGGQKFIENLNWCAGRIKIYEGPGLSVLGAFFGVFSNVLDAFFNMLMFFKGFFCRWTNFKAFLFCVFF